MSPSKFNLLVTSLCWCSTIHTDYITQKYTVNDKSYAKEKLCSFRRFSMNRKNFPMNALNNSRTFNTDEAKIAKAFPTFG